MPFYLRKSVSAGPFRFNFSRGGVGVSVGVKGLRFGTGPRGHYVHAGRNGFYYRATLGRPGQRIEKKAPSLSPPFSPVSFLEDGVEMVEVESGDVLAMRDETFAELLDEINTKRQQVQISLLLGWSLGIIGLFVTLSAGAAWFPLILIGGIGWLVGRWLDSYRRTCVLYYDLDPDVQQAYERTVASFDGLISCMGKWHVEAGGVIQDVVTWKRNAGASHLVRKKPTILTYKLPTAVTSNLTPPAMHVGKQIIYFFPDVALVDDGQKVGGIGYSALQIAWQDSNFIEEGAVPRDAHVIRHTWKHPNKSGGPDRRFKDNRQIPVCRYEAMHLRSTTGLNELVEFSKTGVAGPFADALRNMPKNKALTAVPVLPHKT